MAQCSDILALATCSCLVARETLTDDDCGEKFPNTKTFLDEGLLSNADLISAAHH
jgi:hypothetical protein